MTRKLFGTDGIRGTANAEPMTATTALKVAQAAALQFTRGDHRHTVVIGKDTRLSGYMIESALQAGFVSMGMDVVLLGPLPTPAVAMLTRSLRADVGVMVSASHNPHQDNGIKLFGPDGYKLSDAVEQAIEALIDNGLDHHLPPAGQLGHARRLEDAIGRYIEAVKLTFPREQRLDGRKIVVDCANGAAYRVAPRVLWELGADVIAIGDAPDGTNINDGVGATHPKALADRVVAEGADLGIALDGDADRLILVDETGAVVDGDQVMALIARDWAAQGRLAGGRVVATVMTNLGMERFLSGLGIGLDRTKVGDRYVVEHMRAHGLNVGGEQSGHIVLSDYATTGDGLVAALQVLAVQSATGEPMSALTRVFQTVPQKLRNVRFAAGARPLEDSRVTAAIEAAERDLGDSGRLVIRKSGTEPVIRVMVEADDPAMVDRITDRVAEAVLEAGSADRAAAE